MVLLKRIFLLCLFSIAATHCMTIHCASNNSTTDKESEKKQLELWMKYRKMYIQKEERKREEIRKRRLLEAQIRAAKSKKD